MTGDAERGGSLEPETSDLERRYRRLVIACNDSAEDLLLARDSFYAKPGAFRIGQLMQVNDEYLVALRSWVGYGLAEGWNIEAMDIVATDLRNHRVEHLRRFTGDDDLVDGLYVSAAGLFDKAITESLPDIDWQDYDLRSDHIVELMRILMVCTRAEIGVEQEVILETSKVRRAQLLDLSEL